MLQDLAKNWWLMLLRGIAAIGFGIFAWTWPGVTLAVLLMFYAVYALVEGVSALFLGLSGKEGHHIWWQMILTGLLGIATAILTVLWPKLTAVLLLLFIASWAILHGIFEVAAAIRLRKEIEGEWMMIVSGVLAILFGIFLFMRPGAGILTMVWLMGIFAAATGALQVALALRLRQMKHHPPGDTHHALGT
ncbi:MAG: HdeD family acid-resistance protein [Verrucomicrobiaceae bacterium]|nr:MAG: HdeD family acid-resistance protein [Verrucomicrobiaceae bacterium]